MDKDELIRQLKAQNKLLRKECQAAEEMDKALKAYLTCDKDGFTTRRWQKYTRLWNKWQAARKARLATEPPF